MSATRDKNQKVAFVYSNLYQLYRKGTEAAQSAPQPKPSSSPVSSGPVSSGIIKGDVLKSGELSSPHAAVQPYRPVELMAKRQGIHQGAKAVLPRPSLAAPNESIQSLKDNLKALNDLHSRLRFMLQELEDLVKE